MIYVNIYVLDYCMRDANIQSPSVPDLIFQPSGSCETKIPRATCQVGDFEVILDESVRGPTEKR